MTRTGRDTDIDIDIDDTETNADDRSEPTAVATRRGTIRTTHDRADVIAAAVHPDNTPEMDTRVEDRTVVTTIERETTGGLQSTVDDYVVNLSVAAAVVETVGARNRHREGEGSRSDGGENHPETESHTNATEPEHESDTDSKEHS